MGPGRVNHIEDVIQRGDVLDVLVQEVDKARGRIGLKLVHKHENGGFVSPDVLVERGQDAPPREPRPGAAPRRRRSRWPARGAPAATSDSRARGVAWGRRSEPRSTRPAARAAAYVGSARMPRYLLTRLDSGVRVISARLPPGRAAAIGLGVGVGSRDERDARAGVSHFIEHLLFKGSRRWSALEIAEIFDELGGELNAATSREHTVVYTRVPDNRVEEALEVMGDMVVAPRFDDLDAEREVVLEEIAMYEDSPQDLVHDLLGEAVFEGHPLGRRVIGNAEVISSVTRRALRDFHRSFYAPANIVVAAAGNIDHDALVAGVELAYADRSHPAALPARRLLREPPRPGLRFQRKDTEQYHVCLGAPGISRSDPLRFAASILDAILGGSASSRLFQEIREKRGLAYSVYSFGSQYADTGQVGIYVGTREDNLVQALAIAAAQVADIASGNLAAAELRRAKENLKGRMLLSMESTSSRMQRLGKSLVTDTEILPLERVIAEIEAVEAASVCGLGRRAPGPARALGRRSSDRREERVLEALEGLTPSLAAAA